MCAEGEAVLAAALGAVVAGSMPNRRPRSQEITLRLLPTLTHAHSTLPLHLITQILQRRRQLAILWRQQLPPSDLQPE